MENVIYIENVSFKCTQDDLYEVFLHFGPIKRVKIFSINYQNVFYPVGYACIQFLNSHGYKNCLSFDKNLILHNKKIEIHSGKPETLFPRSIFVFFSNINVNEDFILSFFHQNQPSKVTILIKPSIHNYGFSIVEFPTVENRDIVLYDYFRAQSFNMNASRFSNNILTIIEPPSNLLELSINIKNQNKPLFLEDNNNFYLNKMDGNLQNFNNFNEEDDQNSPSISFSPSGVSYFENKYYEHYLNLSIIHKRKEYRVNSFIASSFSLRIKQLLMENSIIETIESRFDKKGPFELISNSLLGLPIDITSENSIFLFIAASDFGIEDLKRKTYGFVFNQMTIGKAFEMNDYLSKLNVYEGPHSDYLALNFDQILPNLKKYFSEKLKESELHELCFLASIFRSKFFTVKDPHQFSRILLDFIKEKDDEIENQRRKFLIQFLKMKEMDLEEAKNVIEDKSLNLNQISEPIFTFLKEKSKEINSQIQSNQFHGEIEKCLRQNSLKQNHGIFVRLSEIYGENPQDLQIINVTSSSLLESIIDTSENKSMNFVSPNIQNSWICINFFNNPIKLTSYAIKYSKSLNSEDDDSNQLISWKIEGSVDCENWVLIDERRNEKIDEDEFLLNIENSIEDENNFSNSMQKRRRRKKSKKITIYKWKVFKINFKDFDDENLFNFIKITQIDKNDSNNYRLKIQGIEFYGSIPSQQIEILYNQPKLKFQKGIFSCLFDLCEGTNPIQKDLLSICSSCDAKYLIDQNFQGYWCSPPIKNAFVEIDLKQMKLELKSYSLKCHNGEENDFIKSWKIEVSNDGINWILVDKRENRTEYKRPFENYFWECKFPYVDPIRFIRIVNTNESNNIFCLANIELYGILHRP